MSINITLDTSQPLSILVQTRTLNLGTSTLVDGLNGVAFRGDALIPLADLGAIEAGNTFVNVLTHNPTGEIGGTLSTLQISPVPEPSSFILFASGIAGLAWWRRKKKIAA